MTKIVKNVSSKTKEKATSGLTVTLRKTRGRSTSQQRWLTRQLNDPYVRAAHQEGWRSRAAFKLLELDERFHLLRSGIKVVDLGAAPGGWSQVAVRRKASKVIGIDLLPIEAIAGANIIQGDFTDPQQIECLIKKIDGGADLVLSDMAPNTTGHSMTDHIRIMDLAGQALDFALQVLNKQGGFVAKVLQGGTEKEMLNLLKQHFSSVRHAKPPASRKDSRELYVIAKGFKGAVK